MSFGTADGRVRHDGRGSQGCRPRNRLLTVVSWRVSRLSGRDELMALLAKYAPRRSSWNLHRTFLVCNHTLKRRRTAPTPPVAIVHGRQPPLPLLSCNIFVPSDTITDVWRQSLVAELRL